MVDVQVDVGHPLVDDKLPQVPPWRRVGARERQAVRQLLGHSGWGRQGVNYKVFFLAVHITFKSLQANNIQCLTLIVVSIIQQIPSGYSSLVNILVSQIPGASG